LLANKLTSEVVETQQKLQRNVDILTGNSWTVI